MLTDNDHVLKQANQSNDNILHQHFYSGLIFNHVVIESLIQPRTYSVGSLLSWLVGGFQVHFKAFHEVIMKGKGSGQFLC